MASGQTANYQLNQWEAEDKVLRTEFNADNAKLDAALAGLAAALAAIPLVRLCDFTLTAQTGKIEIDLSEYDMTQYRELWIYLEAAASSHIMTGYLDGVPNGTNQTVRLASVNIGEIEPNRAFCKFIVWLGGYLSARGIYNYQQSAGEFSAYNGENHGFSLLPENLDGLEITGYHYSGSVTYGAGTRVQIYALKK